MARSVGCRGLRVREPSARRRILSAYRAARIAGGDPRGTQCRRDSIRWAKKAFPSSHPWTTRCYWATDWRSQYPWCEFLRLLRMVALADDLSHQTAASREESARRFGLDARPLFRKRFRVRNNATAREQAHG